MYSSIYPTGRNVSWEFKILLSPANGKIVKFEFR